QRHARALVDHIPVHAHRGSALERRRAVLQELDSRWTAEAQPGDGDSLGTDRLPGSAWPVHAADLAERPTLREHARRPHPDSHLPRTDLHPAELLPDRARPDYGNLLRLRGWDRRHD